MQAQSSATLQIMHKFNRAFVEHDGTLLENMIAEDCVMESHAIIRWRYRFGPELSQSVRGVNVMRVRDGLIVEALGYAKSGGA